MTSARACLLLVAAAVLVGCGEEDIRDASTPILSAEQALDCDAEPAEADAEDPNDAGETDAAAALARFDEEQPGAAGVPVDDLAVAVEHSGKVLYTTRVAGETKAAVVVERLAADGDIGWTITSWAHCPADELG